MARVTLPKRWRVLQELLFLVFLTPTVVWLEGLLHYFPAVSDAITWKSIGTCAGGLLLCAALYAAERSGRLVYVHARDEEELLRDRRLRLPEQDVAGQPIRRGRARPIAVYSFLRRVLWCAVLAGVVLVTALAEGRDSHPVFLRLLAPAAIWTGGLILAGLAVEAVTAVVRAARVLGAGRESDLP